MSSSRATIESPPLPPSTKPPSKNTDVAMNDETDELSRAVAVLIGNIGKLKDIAAQAQPGTARALETRKLIGEMARDLRRHRKEMEKKLRRHPYPEDQRRIAIEQIELIRAAEIEAAGEPMTAPKMTIENLYEVYAHLQGQIAATTNLAAALAALHPDKQTIERVIQFTATSNGYQQAGGSPGAERAYEAGMEYAMGVFRAALAGLAVRC
jgi:hypothetical protein